MKRLFLIGVLVLPSLYAGAKSNKMDCDDIHEVATNIMAGRQNGVEITKFMDVVKQTKGEGGVLELLVLDAYEQHKFSSEEYKVNATKEFANKWYLNCRKANKKL